MMRKMLVVMAALVLAVGIGSRTAAGEDKAKQPTSEDILRKCADTYKSMESYYEETLFTLKLGTGKDLRVRKGKAIILFERGGELRVGIDSDRKLAIIHSGSQMRVFEGGAPEPTTIDDQSISQVYAFLTGRGFPLFLLEAYFSDDPYAVMTDGVTEIKDVETVKFGGRDAYLVQMTSDDGAVSHCYFDTDTCVLIGVTVTTSTESPAGAVPMTISFVAGDVRPNGPVPEERLLSDTGIPGFAPGRESPASKRRMKREAKYPTYAMKWHQASDFELSDLSGGTVRLSEHRGEVVVLDFWAIFCPPCRQALPALIKMAKDYEGEPFAYYAISTRDSREAIGRFATQNSLDIPALIAAGSAVPRDYRVAAIPSIFILDKDGVIRFVEVGWGGIRPIQQMVDFLLGTKPRHVPKYDRE